MTMYHKNTYQMSYDIRSGFKMTDATAQAMQTPKNCPIVRPKISFI